MKPTLQLKLSQQLTLTPQLQQAIKLLQLSTLEMNQEIERLLQENPLLERSDAGEPAESTESAESGEGSEAQSEADFDEDFFENASSYGADAPDDDEGSDHQAAHLPDLREHLLWQLSMSALAGQDKRNVNLLIEALDDNGYLSQPLEELASMLPEPIEIDELSIALQYLQSMDPPGVGARNLSECLAIQLRLLPEGTPAKAEALRIVNHHLDNLAAHDYGKLKKLLNCEEETLKMAQELIVGLNPRPGSIYSDNSARYIVPDVLVKKTKGGWVANLNQDAIPKLRVNKMYAEILKRGHESGFSQISGQLQEAKWLIKNVQQRFETILKVSQAIVGHQKNFLEHGEVAMRPLVLREIADEIGLHESTVSRVTTQKFMMTPRGIFELKYFFGSHVATEAGGACSATAIRALIKQLVSSEDSKMPLSDSQISEILGRQGIVVARRTIAKYRESLKIPPVNLRKSL